jgi:hypothetical protein
MAEAIGVKKLESGSTKFCSRTTSTLPALDPQNATTSFYNYTEKQGIITMSLNCKWRTSSTKKNKSNHTFQEKKTAPKLPGLNKA